MRKQRVAFIKRVAEGMFANQPAHVLLCFDQGSHHCSTEIMRQGNSYDWSWSRLELMPNLKALSQRGNWCWSADGRKRRRTSQVATAALSKLAGREAALMGVKGDGGQVPPAQDIKYIDCPGPLGGLQLKKLLCLFSLVSFVLQILFQIDSWYPRVFSPLLCGSAPIPH